MLHIFGVERTFKGKFKKQTLENEFKDIFKNLERRENLFIFEMFPVFVQKQ